MPRSQANDSSAAAPARDNYLAMHRGFGWQVPRALQHGPGLLRRAGRPAPDAAQRVAVLADGTGATPRAWTYAELQAASNRLSNALAVLGVQRGDRVAIVLPQRFETAVAYMAVLQMGAVAMPLSMLFGPEALEFRLQDSEAVVAICDAAAIDALESVRANCPLLRVGDPGRAARQRPQSGIRGGAGPGAGRRSSPATPQADEAAVLIYTSGTTGQPKGALIAAPRPDRQPERFRLQPELVRFRPGARRLRLRGGVLVAGRLGLDRRPDGRLAADPVFRPAHRGLERPLQPADGVRTDADATR